MKNSLRVMALSYFLCSLLAFNSFSFAYEGTGASGTQQAQMNTHRRQRSDKSIMNNYLSRARQFRNDGRYELARQSYVQALSVCSDEETLLTIRNELNGVELLLRTMR